ncbi:uncharacterized protein LOC122196261 [Lactuca sativa]|uniref:uncharacterized protein LOC122196261 n=1 Tax=Lactuca sativa TaxID=4236 RepID=UPI000CBFAAC1|nr:uncharacterized protein LOC122196261 [Lactuca sativa]
MSISESELHCITNPNDFTFCDTREGKYHQKQDGNENPLCFSSPLWSKNVPSSYTCPSSPTKSIAEGRKELMEMINSNLPESCYELSFEDIVLKDRSNSVSMMEERVDMKLDLEKKRKGTKKSQISRSVSLDTGVFLLKTFVPGSFGPKKHKVSQSTSDGDLRKPHVDVKRWKTWPFGERLWKLYGCLCTSKPTNQRGCIFF